MGQNEQMIFWGLSTAGCSGFFFLVVCWSRPTSHMPHVLIALNEANFQTTVEKVQIMTIHFDVFQCCIPPLMAHSAQNLT